MRQQAAFVLEQYLRLHGSLQCHGSIFVTGEFREIAGIPKRFFEKAEAEFQAQHTAHRIVNALHGDLPLLDKFPEIDTEIPTRRYHSHVDTGIDRSS